ncbi:hypothetical protein GpartN1_g3828.t1 [Galdieria partita]|uniref:Nucleotide-diphospho-sugar transferase domain-containing protein n=1 Tax=Galdieria partita TaxID=83374 RepID=A0A9C7UR13_9RHOD|nr:hypothetical protein GpartN1_g3828.t1 [Galdieria partita]
MKSSGWIFFWSTVLLLLSIYQMKHMESLTLRSISKADYSWKLDKFSLEIFAAPKPFIGQDREINIRAIKSWLRLKPKPEITLLGDEIGYEEICREYGLRQEKRLDRNFMGVPLFNSMVDRANRSEATVAVIINGDIMLFDDFIQTVKKMMLNFRHWFIIGARWDIDGLPEGLHEKHPQYSRLVREHVLSHGRLHTYGGMDVWAWNTNGPPLFDGVMPHFVFGRGKYDNWLTHETIQAGRREVIDISETSLMVHIKHDYHLVSAVRQTSSQIVEGELSDSRKKPMGAFWSEGKRQKWELFLNIYLALSTGSYVNQVGTVIFAPWKTSLCMEPSGMCLLRRRRPGVCPCEQSSFVPATQTDPIVKNGSRVIQCGRISVETKESFEIPVLPKPNQPVIFGLPLLLEHLLERNAINNSVILVAMNYGYRSFLMNFVCNLRQLGLFPGNLIVAALDEDMYRFAFTRGLPVYFENTVYSKEDAASVVAASYGSDSFKKLTKMKSRVVLRILKLGYDVIWTDCDIVWFRNPIPYLQSQNADLIIQSNAPDNENPNERRRINSGFYLARSNPHTIEAFEDVIQFAAKSRMTEQPCFYDLWCGKQGENAKGKDRCIYKDKFQVLLLDRKLFPNGITEGIWDSPAGKIQQLFPHLYILHNNWVKGNQGKMERYYRHGYIFYDNHTELCSYPQESLSLLLD